MLDEHMQRQKTVCMVFAQGEWLTARQVNERQCSPPTDEYQPVAEWKSQGRVFSVTFDGEEYFAGYQFDAKCQPLPVIRDVLQALGDVGDSWRVAAWFHFPNGWICGAGANGNQPVAPMDALDRPNVVIDAARHMRGECVA